MSIARSHPRPPGATRARGERVAEHRGLATSAAPDAGTPSLEARIALRFPLDVRATLGPLRRGPGDPCVVFDDAGVWLAYRTVAGPVTLLVTGTRTEVRLRAWGSGASEALHQAPQLLGLDDDWSDLDTSAHDLLASSAHRNPGLRLCRTGRVLDSLAPAIVEQKVTSAEALRAWRILVTRNGEAAPGPAPERMRLPLLPEHWRRIPSWEWHRAGVDPRRSKTVIQAAVVARSLERSTAVHTGGHDLWRLLRTVNGVGGWTAAETAQRSHGDPDAVSFGDYHLASWIGSALVGEPVDDDGLAELLEPWAGQRQRIVRLVLASGFRPERHGPRMTIQDHRGH
ncbi:DNA-3-methyladenine glycosylase 2 family protein [Herbiconiux sp.]|uniref:DNA-3-methyladenine glycosylase family protein n=1 Tax=Herbiconiux sp. TaxID=1871186 RepID=UPI0025BBB28B|nr:DNA-3-methyladenine glycosylase 2 family protein [Herbiconiux sp.]